MSENNKSSSSTNRPLIREWKHMRGPEFRELDREKTVVLLTCSPLEVHGPHLPMITDICEGEGIARRSLEVLYEKHPEITYVRLPYLWVAADVLPQPGSIKFRPSTVIQVITDLGRSLARQGFRHIWLSNFHGGPRHFVALETAAYKVSKKYKVRMVSLFSLLIRRLTGGKNDMSDVLGHLEGVEAEHLEGDMHAGFIETSLMLHLLEEYVDKNYPELERITVDTKLEDQGKTTVHEGKATLIKLIKSFKANIVYYETETYSGHPGAGSAEMGKKILDTLAELAAESLSELWEEKVSLKECTSPIFPIRHVFMNSVLGWFFEKLAGHKNEIW